MLISLFSKDYRFFSLKNIIGYIENKPSKDLICCFHQTVESFLLQAGAIYPGDLQRRMRETSGKINLFYTKNLLEYKSLKQYKKGKLTKKGNVIYNCQNEPLLELKCLSELDAVKSHLCSEKYSTVIIDERFEKIKEEYIHLNDIKKEFKEITFISVDGIII